MTNIHTLGGQERQQVEHNQDWEHTYRQAGRQSEAQLTQMGHTDRQDTGLKPTPDKTKQDRKQADRTQDKRQTGLKPQNTE